MFKTFFKVGLPLALCWATGVAAELAPEPIPSVATLPKTYPDTWLFAHDANFHSLIAGKVVIVDVAADSQEVKGMIDAAQMATFAESKHQPVLFVAESFYARNTRGERTDVVTVYDRSSLKVIDEILLPNTNRGQTVTNKNAMQLIDDDKFLLIYGFTPAQSIIVIDTKTREVVNDVSIAGCALAFPLGQRGFMSLCSNGAMLSVQLDEKGQETSRKQHEPFFNVDQDPLFDKAVFDDTTAYFISYQGKIQPIDISGEEPKVLPGWSLVNEAEQGDNWRPGGWQISALDKQGHLYVVMHENGYDGSHKFGGETIWKFDVKSQTKVAQLSLKDNAFSIEVTHSKTPYLAVTNVNMGLDVYSVEGKFQRYINVSDTAMPIILHAGKH
ncbi:amine dehydrogenase large subunit [Halioxenophilus aromaticivorans]